MPRIIISGATGAIGLALIDECIKNNIEVLVLTRKSSLRNARIPVNPLVEIAYCSLEDMKNMNNTTNKEYDVFYHFAWEGTVGAARNDMFLQNRNVEYSLYAVELAGRFGCHTFVGAGSQAEYGRVEGLLHPDTPTKPEMGYGIAKLCAGQMTSIHARQQGLKHIWVRILSVFGPYDGDNSMVSSVMRSLAKGESPKCTLGEQKWDYLYSKDAASAFLSLGYEGVDGKTYVLGSGNVYPLKYYIETMQRLVAPDIEVDFGAVPYSEKQVMYLGADITEIQKDIQWKPQYTFEEGIKEILKIGKEEV